MVYVHRYMFLDILCFQPMLADRRYKKDYCCERFGKVRPDKKDNKTCDDDRELQNPKQTAGKEDATASV